MKKRILVSTALLSLSLFVFIYIWCDKPDLNKPIAQLVTEKGKPSFLAESFRVDQKILDVLVLPQDPQTVTNWASISNLVLIWCETESGKRNARYFYDEMKNDKSFDGGGWYSSEYLFGEDVTIVTVSVNGKILDQKILKVVDISMKLMDFVRHHSSFRSLEERNISEKGIPAFPPKTP